MLHSACLLDSTAYSLGSRRAGGYNVAMDDKLPRDRSGEIFQDELTENQSKPRPSRLEDAAHNQRLDPNVDSQEGDEAMAQDRFERNEPRRSQS